MNIATRATAKVRQPLEPLCQEAACLGAPSVEIRISHRSACHSDLHLIGGDRGTPRDRRVPEEWA